MHMKPKIVRVNNKQYKITKSERKNKQAKVKVGNKFVHFGDPRMPEFPGTKRAKKYCARSLGIKNKKGERTAFDINSPNFWSRKVLWDCDQKQKSGL